MKSSLKPTQRDVVMKAVNAAVQETIQNHAKQELMPRLLAFCLLSRSATKLCSARNALIVVRPSSEAEICE